MKTKAPRFNADEIARQLTPNRLLRVIDAYFVYAHHTGKSYRRDDQKPIQVWRILTALRGPDTSGDDVKNRTTARIRTLALPRTQRVQAAGSWATFARPLWIGRKRHCLDAEVLPNEDGHFFRHIRSAKEALRTLRRLP